VPRPPTKTDTEILAAAARLVLRDGTLPTLAGVAREVGLSGPRLAQRFGSRRGLLLAMAKQNLARANAQLRAVRASATGSAIDALLRVIDAGMAGVDSQALTNLFLTGVQQAQSDPELRGLSQAIGRIKLRAVRDHLDLAVERGELAPTDTTRLARMVLALSGGSVLLSLSEGNGRSPARNLKRDLLELLAHYRPRRSAGTRVTRPRGRGQTRM